MWQIVSYVGVVRPVGEHMSTYVINNKENKMNLN